MGRLTPPSHKKATHHPLQSSLTTTTANTKSIYIYYTTSYHPTITTMNLRCSSNLWLLTAAMPTMVSAFSQSSSVVHSVMTTSPRPIIAAANKVLSSTILSMSSPDVDTDASVSASSSDDVSLVITGNNIDLTPALQEYVEKRIGSILNKLGSGGIVRECDVHLSVCKNPKVRFVVCRA